MPGEIPQSTALAEADPNSLGELMSRDPEGYQRQDRDRIIAALRADRERRAQAAETAAAKGGKPKALKLSELPPPSATPDGLGL
jgi:hypothetical protein